MKYKRTIVIAFFGILGLSPFAVSAATNSDSILYSVKVTPGVTVLNERSGPGITNRRVGQLRQGETVAVYAEDKGWFRVSTKPVWVDARYVAKTAAEDTVNITGAREVPVVQKTDSILYSVKVTPGVTVLNERSGPGITNRRVGQLRQGETVAVYAEDKGWFRVSTKPVWVDARYVAKTVKDEAAATEIIAAVPTTKTVKTITVESAVARVSSKAATTPTAVCMQAIRKADLYCQSHVPKGCPSGIVTTSPTPRCVAANEDCAAHEKAALAECPSINQ